MESVVSITLVLEFDKSEAMLDIDTSKLSKVLEVASQIISCDIVSKAT